MIKFVFAGALAFALVVSPGYAAKKTTSRAPQKAALSQQQMEDLAWSGTAKAKPKPVAKKTTKKKPTDQATVEFNNRGKKPTVKKTDPVVVATPTPAPVTDPTPMVANTDAADPNAQAPPLPKDLENKTPEELERAAGKIKDPKQAMGIYQNVLERDPNYRYSGDVYAQMYNLSRQSNGDVLQQMKYAGLAAQKLEAHQSRNAVDPRQVNNYNKAVNDLTNKWIEEETRKILAGQE